MNLMRIKDQFDPVIRKKIRTTKIAAVIPVGSLEQHGPHLPVSTDSDIVTKVCERISEKNNFLLLPTVNYGVSYEHAPYFNVSVTKSTLSKILADMILSLEQNKISNVFVINGHHGNIDALRTLEKSKAFSKKTKVFTFSYWHFMSQEFDHAGFVETSLMLAISKNVNMKKAVKGFSPGNISAKQRQAINKKASKSFISVTKNGVWGDPRDANSRDGKKILAEIVTNLGKKCQTCLTGKSPKLHQ